jgi:hypothetical protein
MSRLPASARGSALLSLTFLHRLPANPPIGSAPQ